MDILLSFGMFVFGFFAEKLLDFIFNLFKIKLKKIKKREKINNFYKTEHENIIITATGVPYFYPKQIQENISKSSNFLLAKPANLNCNDASSFSEVDCVSEDFKKYIINNSLQDKLEEIREEIFRSFNEASNGNYFNGSLLGINKMNGFKRTADVNELPILSIEFYKTDYFTHKIIERLIKNTLFSEQMINSTTDFSWSRTSFGISVILIIPKQNEIILTKRSKNTAYADDFEWIYVSVTETLSDTDINEETGEPDLRKCVLRGIKEELGISERDLKIDTLYFYDSFYETHFHQDNIIASIEISNELSFSDIYSLIAKDKFLEVSDIITISNDKKSITRFINDNKNEMRAQTVFALNSYIARMD